MSTIAFDSVVIADMIGEALDLCARRTGLADAEEALAALRDGNCSVCEYLRHGLATGIAGYLGSLDDTVQAVYSYDPERATSVDEPIVSRGINLIAQVSRKSAALASVVSLVRTSLAEERGRLACRKADALCCSLDIQVADEGEVRSRSGYGALVDSLYVRPQEIWRR